MNMKSMAVGLCLTVGALALTADEVKFDAAKLPPASAKKDLTFDKDIRPLFEKACFKCHGPEVEKPKGKYRADTKAHVVKEHVVEPGSAAKSGILGMIAYIAEDEEMFMPPKGNKAKIAPLTKEEVGIVRAWIEQGAK
jgi:hypothetical protein